MTTVSINLEAERARAAEKRERAALEARALLILTGRWDLDEAGLRSTITERYPQLAAAEVEQLTRVALDVQEKEAPKRIPVESIEVQLPELKERRVESHRDSRPTWDQMQRDVLEVRRAAKAKAAPRPKPIAKPEQEDEMGRKRLEPEELRRLIRITLKSQPEIAQTECRRLIESRTRCAPINPGTFNSHWKRARQDMGLPLIDERKNNGLTQSPPAVPETTEAAPAEATDGDQEWREDAVAVLDEMQPTRTAVEAPSWTRSLDYLRLEQEPDGAWTLSASITFEDADAANRALARLVVTR